ncbi:nicotinate phosphoribosyltransferase [Pelolinea submarina]|uniref:Nicotinate phosphoribosyltransferase n=1 Tax=Pelolinea submarina TaxID=913107 RepID=A0A347ZSL5_9CHLR|nr:nicotinate phosphoribosyltransferase [Pelolinea submarina]REG11135.1 nicotinate phosphoribosyltransferase [Pelolinea submarina]BBB48296.1 nicotinate phosphoribosyltransferase [Pelolinea submarina]
MKSQQQQFAEGVLFTDFYQLTMAQVYHRMGIHESKAQFDYFFRSYPDYGIHQAGYCVNAGLETFMDWVSEAYFKESEIDYLRNLKDANGRAMFTPEFLKYLQGQSVATGLTLRAVPEGRVIHPYVPNAIVEGPLIFAQLIETSLLNHLNYQTLIATKAARIYESGMGQAMLEFGLRRAQDRSGFAGARAAIIGGAAGTSNVGASAVLGYQPSGTHAHSMIQAIVAMGGTELDAFEAYAESYPDACILLVDTYDTLNSGIPNAIKVFEKLKAQGHKPVGIRMDSGDLAFLTIQAALMLNKAGFPDTKIVLSNQMDELVIWQIITQIKEESARYGLDADNLISRLAYGVGTRLITSEGDPALDGVFKLVAMQQDNAWVPAIKISENPEKTLNPGYKKIWRLYDQSQKAIADVLSLEGEDLCHLEAIHLHHPTDQTKQRVLNCAQISKVEKLHETILEDGKLVYEFPTLEQIRQTRADDIQRLHSGVRRLMNPHNYHVSLTDKLWNLKEELIFQYTNGTKG